ncbi:unnamed protein product, partial [Allacma fusca]
MKVLVLLSVLAFTSGIQSKRPSRTANPAIQYATAAEASATHSAFAHEQHAKLLADHQQKRLHNLAFSTTSSTSQSQPQGRVSSQVLVQQQERIKSGVEQAAG